MLMFEKPAQARRAGSAALLSRGSSRNDRNGMPNASRAYNSGDGVRNRRPRHRIAQTGHVVWRSV